MNQNDITELLMLINEGDEHAWKIVLEKTYPILLDIAAAQRNHFHNRSETLDTYGLVHEAFLSLYYSKQVTWNDRKHFYFTIAKAIRYLLLNYERSKRNLKNRGDAEHIEFNEETIWLTDDEMVKERISTALDTLVVTHERAYQGVMLRFFLGMQEKEVAEILEISTRTVIRDWIVARALLAKALLTND